MRRISFGLMLFLSFVAIQLPAQVPLGEWHSHLSYRYFKSVAAAGNLVYAATEEAVAYYNPATDALTDLTTINGLSDIGVALLKYAPEAQTVIVAYNNCNLDLIVNNSVYNVPDIKNKEIIGTKEIRQVFVHGDKAYILCSFGVVIVDLKRKIILDSWFTQAGDYTLPVNDLTIHDGRYFMATDNGIFYTPVNHAAVADFASWQQIPEFEQQKIKLIFNFNETLYTVKHNALADSVFKSISGSWTYMESYTDEIILSMDMASSQLLFCYSDRVVIYDAEDSMVQEKTWNWANAAQAVFGLKDQVWVADKNFCLYQIFLDSDKVYCFQANGPFVSQVYRMGFGDGVLAAVPGALTSSFTPTYWSNNFSYLKNNTWSSVENKDYKLILQDLHHPLTAVAVHPQNGQDIYMGSWGFGLIYYHDAVPQTVYGENNSSLQETPLIASDKGYYISCLEFDNKGQLWVAQSHAAHPLSVKNSSDQWFSFAIPPIGGGSLIKRLLIDSRNYKWIATHRAPHLTVFYDNNTFDNPSDDKYKSIEMNTTATHINTGEVNCLAEDLEGRIWIGTDKGIKVIFSPGNVFSSSGAYPQNILMEQNGYVHPLLEFETVTAIAVDGANRKWIGTSKAGIFLISADGTEELLHFSEDNSPLFSNEIKDIQIHPKTGEVFIATAYGLIGYMGDATYGAEDYSEVKVFPNPVRPDFTGTIAINGLKQNSYFKITDSFGNLVYQNYANGSEGTWNGKTFGGQKAATGVYFVMAADEDGKAKHVAKIVFIQ